MGNGYQHPDLAEQAKAQLPQHDYNLECWFLTWSCHLLPGWEAKIRILSRRNFLAEMDQVVAWQRLIDRMEPSCEVSGLLRVC